MPTSIYLSTPHTARLWGILPDTLRQRVRQHGHYKGVKPRKLPSGELTWPRESVLATLPNANLNEGQRGAWAALEACTGTMRPTPEEQTELLGVIHSVPYAQRHDLGRLLAQFDLVFRTLAAADRAELYGRMSLGDHSTDLSPAARRQLAAELQRIIDQAVYMRDRLLDAANKGDAA